MAMDLLKTPTSSQTFWRIRNWSKYRLLSVFGNFKCINFKSLSDEEKEKIDKINTLFEDLIGEWTEQSSKIKTPVKNDSKQ